MTARKLALSLIALLCLVSGAQSQVHPQQPAPQPDNQPANQSERIGESSAWRIVLDDIVKIFSREDAPDDEREKRREAREVETLSINERMRGYAHQMVWLTFAQAFFALVTIGLVFATFRLTRKSNERQLRAYVSAEIDRDRITITPRKTDAGLVYDIKVVIVYRNHGQTPAHNMTN